MGRAQGGQGAGATVGSLRTVTPPRWTQTYLLPEGSGEVADLWDPGAGPLFWSPAPSHLLGGRKWAGLVPRSWPPRPCIPRLTSSPQDISSKTPALERLERGRVTGGSDSQPHFSPRPLSGLLDETRGKKSRLEGSTAFQTRAPPPSGEQACARSGGGRPLHCLPDSALQHLGVNYPLSFLPPRPSFSPRPEPPAPHPQLSPTGSGLEKGWGPQTPEPTSPSAWRIPTDRVPRAVRGRREAPKVRDGRQRRREQETDPWRERNQGASGPLEQYLKGAAGPAPATC